jgi:hypothetical protein
MLKVPLRLTSPQLLEASGDVEASLYFPSLLGSRFVLLVSSRFALRPAACAKPNMRFGNRLLPWTSLVSAQPRQLEQHSLPFRLDRSRGFAPQGDWCGVAAAIRLTHDRFGLVFAETLSESK